jgi:hypothetical protein
MKYDLRSPCSDCPFRTDVRPYITVGRVAELPDVPFSCHKTTTCKNRRNSHPDAQHCAGSLIIHEKMDRPHQMMRIAERLRMYDRTKLNMTAPVYNSFEEMMNAHENA